MAIETDIETLLIHGHYKMEEVDVKWCKVWIVAIIFKDIPVMLAHTSRNALTTGTIDTIHLKFAENSNILIAPVKAISGPYVPKNKTPERFYYLQKTLADKKVQTLKAQEVPGFKAEVSINEDIGWTYNGGATININHMAGRHDVNTD